MIVKSLCDFCNFLVLSASLTQRHYLEDDLGSGVWGVTPPTPPTSGGQGGCGEIGKWEE
ncbi:hypothetical protein [Microcystis sp. M40BS1]|uniref:hypothetical protein n=1 Tax=Microcystis sp. M40BS1 TaxID=2771190 RepID=UPI0025830062|nr:hypothetical protein [Microcystis sp. M40BS1]